jgi:8-oxo-dGTP pyrophosphatase MutT (NUDIX family)
MVDLAPVPGLQPASPDVTTRLGPQRAVAKLAGWVVTGHSRMSRMPTAVKSMITALVSGIEPTDDLGREHTREVLSWLARTDDIFRRAKPLTPSPHLVSYFLLVDRLAGSVLLCDHRLSGLWLPPGGHVEPGEHPIDTVRREAVEELGVTARPASIGSNPTCCAPWTRSDSAADRRPGWPPTSHPSSATSAASATLCARVSRCLRPRIGVVGHGAQTPLALWATATTLLALWPTALSTC